MKKQLFLLSMLSVTLLCFSQELIDGIAAIVGEHIILRSEVEQFARLNASQLNIEPRRNPEKFKLIYQQSLDALIDEKILLEQAKIETIEVKNRDVEMMLEQQIESIIQQAGSKERAEKILGSPISQIKKDYYPIVKNRLIIEQLRSEKFKDVTVTRREIEEFYEHYKDSIPEIPQTYDFSHILFSISPGEREEREALAKADSILNRLKEGEDFGKLAKLYSDDPGSAREGGNLSYISRGGFIKEFEEVAFSLEKGQISDIVKTDFGYHIIQLIDRKGEKINVRHILIRPKISEQNIIETKHLADSIRNCILTESISFDSAVILFSDDAGAHLNRGRIRIPRNQIQQAEFLQVLDTLEPSGMSQVFRTSMGFHILKLNGIYDNTWSVIERWALEYKKSNLYQEWLSELKSQFYIDLKVSL
jgi:peptidyl-prolyl cis-trans isomerase SurA